VVDPGEGDPFDVADDGDAHQDDSNTAR
jgi:hypothetical protein